MKNLYQLVDFKDNSIYTKEQLYFKGLVTGLSKDYSELRAQGILCHRAELDNQPKVVGFTGPMWDGFRYQDEFGTLYSTWQLTEQQRETLSIELGGYTSTLEKVAMIRYETEEVYDQLSH